MLDKFPANVDSVSRRVVQNHLPYFSMDPQPWTSTGSLFLLFTVCLLPVDQAEQSDV